MEPSTKDHLLTVLFTAGVIGFVVGIARGVIEERHGGWVGFFRGIVSALVVSTFVGFGLADSAFPPTMQACIIGVCAYISEDIVLGVRKITGEFGRNPLGVVKAVVDAWRGRKSE